jgi:hypothetical protein
MTQSPDFFTDGVAFLCGPLCSVVSRFAGILQISKTLCDFLLPLLVTAGDGFTSPRYIPTRTLL